MIIGNCLYCKKEFRKREHKYKFCSLFCSNNFNKNGLKNVKLPLYSFSLAEFVGICLGDGHISKYQTAVTLNALADKNYIPYVISLAKNLFKGANISVLSKKKENAIDVRINSRIVSDFFLNMGIIPNNKSIPNWIYSDPEYIKACIRGLLDTEGSISFKRYSSRKGISLYKQLNFRNTNMQLMAFVREGLLAIGLKPTLSLTKSLYLSNHKSINRFSKIIGFSNPKLIERSLVVTINDYNDWRRKSSLI